MQINKSAEDYLEAMLILEEEKGYIRSVDIARRLGVSKPSVSRMYALTQQPLFGYRFWPEDEQCQYVNVWTRSPDPSRRRPVMVWVHGGGFGTGSSVGSSEGSSSAAFALYFTAL